MPERSPSRVAPRASLSVRCAALLALMGASLAGGQTPAPTGAGEMRRVEGRVMRGSSQGERPVAGQPVVLHRISSDSAGPLDSMRTGPDGGYRFSYRAAGDGSMYIVSTRYSGIAYFTPPLSQAVVRGDSATVMVYDTASTGDPLVARGRHFIVSPPAGAGNRRVVDVFEVANESAVTRVAGDNPHGTWRVRLPEGVASPQVGQGDVPPDAVRFDQGGATIFAPFPPGIRQVVLTYELPPSGAPVAVPFDQATSTVEILVEGAGAQASGPVERQEAVALEGRQFDRFLGQDLPAGATVSLTLPGGRPSFTRLRNLALVALAGLALTLGALSGRKERAGPSGEPATEDLADPEVLARTIAALDDSHQARANPTDAEVAAYEGRRTELKARLVAALAALDEAGAA